MKGNGISRTILSLLLTVNLVGTDLLFHVRPAHARPTERDGSVPADLARTDLQLPAGPMTLPIAHTPNRVAGHQGLLGTLWQLNWENDQFGAFPGPPESIGAREEFDTAGRRNTQIDRNGNRIVILYDEDGKLARVEGPRDVWFDCTVDGKGLLRKIVTSAGDEILYLFREGELAEVRVNGGAPLRYTYDKEGRLTRFEDPAEGPVDYIRDGQNRITAIRLADGTEERFEYDETAGMVRHIDPAGNSTGIRRSPDGQRIEETDPLGNRTAIDLDDAGRPVAITGPASKTTSMTYDDQGRMTAVEECCGGSRTITYHGDLPLMQSVAYDDGSVQGFDYDEKGNLISIREGADTLLSMTYYPDGLVKSLTGTGTGETRFTYSADGRLHSIINPLGETTRFEYDGMGNITREIDPLGGVNTWVYDNQHRATVFTDPSGATTRFVYDKRGHLVRVKDPAGGETRFEYDTRGRLIGKRTGGGLETRYEYDGSGQLLSVTGPGGALSRFDYDAAGNLVRETNPLGGVSQASYNTLGRQTALTDPNGGSVRFSWNENGMLGSLIDPAGTEITHAYDTNQRRTSVTGPGERVTRYEHDTRGRLSRVVDASGLTTEYEYDRYGILSRVKDNHGLDTKYEYDLLGRVSREVTAAGLETDYRYDGTGNLISRRDNQGESIVYQYDPSGLLVSIGDTRGGTFQYTRDDIGRMMERTDPLGATRRITYGRNGEITRIVEPSGDETRYTYDSAGLVTALRLPGGGTVKFERDAMGNVTLRTSPLGEETRYIYNTAGHLTSVMDDTGRTTSIAYDAAGRLIRKSFSDGRLISLEYDGNGDIIALDDGDYPVRYEYDKQGRVTRINFETVGKEIRYNYGLSGLSTRYFDVTGERVERKYDPHKRIVSLGIPGAGNIAVEYDSRDRVTQLSYPNGVRADWVYDECGRTTSITYLNRSGDTLGGRRYTYDAAGNPTGVTIPDGSARAYKYDVDGRLIEENGPAGTIHYGYLPGGNRAFREDADGKTEYRYDKADRLVRMGNTEFNYDNRGNLVKKTGPAGATQYFYNEENLLVRVVKPDGLEVRFGYGPDGNRIWREDAGGRVWQVTDEYNLLAELDENLEPRARYIHGPGIDKPLVMIRDGEHYYYHADELGTPLFLTDGKGEVVLSYETDVFGRVVSTEGDLENPFLFTGREYDTDLGIYYYRARWYDPDLGRFLTPDPAWSPHSPSPDLNRYVYVRNAPTRFTDPLGRQLVFPRGFTRVEVLFLRQLRIRAAIESGPADLVAIDESLNLDLLQQGGRAPGEGLRILQPQYEANLRRAIEWNRTGRPAMVREWQADLNAQNPNWTDQIRAMDRARGGDPGRSQISVKPPGTVAQPTPNSINRPLPHGRSNLSDTRMQPGIRRPVGDTRITRPPGNTNANQSGNPTRISQLEDRGRWRPIPSQTPGVELAQSITRIGRGTSLVINAGTLGLRYDACREAGHSHIECLKPTILAVGMAVSAGVIAVAALPAILTGLGVSIPVGLAVLTTAGVITSIDAFFETGEEWAQVPDDVATAAQQRGARDLIALRTDILQSLQADLDRYDDARFKRFNACRDAHTHSETAIEIHTRMSVTHGEILASVSNPPVVTGTDDTRCAEQRAAIADVHSFLGRVDEMEETVIRSLEGAEGMAADCKTKTDANKIEELYEIARRLAVQMVQDASEVYEKNLAILEMADDDRTLDTDLVALVAKSETMLTDLGALGDAVSSCMTARDNSKTAGTEAEGIAAEIKSKIATFRSTLDAGVGARGDQDAYSELVNGFTHIEAMLEPKRDLSVCELTDLAIDERVSQKLEAEGWLGEVETAVENARLSAGACGEIAGFEDLLESVESSAGYAMLLVAGQEGLLDRAKECAGEATDDGADIPGLDDAIDDVAGDGLVDFLAFLQLFQSAAADEQSVWENFSSYASAFEQRLRTLGPDACGSQELGYVLVQAEEMIQEHSLILTDLVDYYSYLQGALEELGPDGDESHQIYQAALGHSGAMRSRHAAMIAQLRNDYRCDESDIRRTGEEVAQAGADPDDIDAGVGSTSSTDKEICGDLTDNDGDGLIDECDAGCCEGKVLIEVTDCGDLADDIFLIRLSTGESATTPRGASTFISKDLDPGFYTVTLHVLSAPDDKGTYCLTVSVDGAVLLSKSDAPAQGTVLSWEFEIPGEGAVSKYAIPIIDHAPASVMNREKRGR